MAQQLGVEALDPGEAGPVLQGRVQGVASEGLAAVPEPQRVGVGQPVRPAQPQSTV